MRQLVAALLLAMALAGCGHGPPALTEGTVLRKSFEPAHDDSYTYMQCYAYDPKTLACTVQMPVTQVDHVPDGWSLEVQQCAPDKAGIEKCRHQWVTVTQRAFDGFSTGSHWRR